MHGVPTSEVEVSLVSSKGFWLLVGDEELFVPYEEFPWFKTATVQAITTVQRPAAEHLYWPLLDIDLALGSIRNPASFPLMSRVSSG